MKTFRLPLIFVATMILGHFSGRKHLAAKYGATPTGVR
jgi:hypothetical protein